MNFVASTTGPIMVSSTCFASAAGENAAVAIGAHAAGVGTGIAVTHGLVILRGLERNNILSVTERDETDFLAFEKFFDHQARTERANRCFRFRAVLRDDHAFARRQPVGLDHDG